MPGFNDFDDMLFEIENFTQENLDKAFETDKKEFLNTRYYCTDNHSELIKRSKSHRSRRGSQDSGFPELPNLGRGFSHVSMSSCDHDTLALPNLGRYTSSGLGNDDYSDPYKSTQSGTAESDVPPLMPLLGLTTLLSELCTVYYHMVNLILTDALNNSCEKLAVYSYLVEICPNFSGESLSMHRLAWMKS
jgi:hypothetical protein